jgi:hypothetical protein
LAAFLSGNQSGILSGKIALAPPSRQVLAILVFGSVTGIFACLCLLNDSIPNLAPELREKSQENQGLSPIGRKARIWPNWRMSLAVFLQALRRSCLLAALLLAGCTVGPTSTLMKDLDNANATRLGTKYGDATRLSSAILVAEEDPSGRQRNILLNDLILVVDLNYNHWEKLLYDKKAGFDLSTDAAVLALGGATALTGTTEVANVLGQITTGITGFKTSVDSDVLQKNAVPALVAKMRAARATQLLKMQAAMVKTTNGGPAGPTQLSKYSVEQGLIDLNAYYNAGTFVSALQDITAKAAEEKKAADQKIDETKPNATLIRQTPNAPGG